MKETCICCNGKGYIIRIKPIKISLKTVLKVKKLYSQGLSLREIGKQTGYKHAQSIKNIINKKDY